MPDTAPTDGDKKPGGTQPGDDAKSGKVFSQAEVDRIVSQVKAKTARQIESIKADVGPAAINAWREEMGIDDNALEKLQTVDKAAMEQRKLKSNLTKSENRIKELEALLGRQSAKLRDVVSRDAVLLEATKVSHDPELVWIAAASRVSYDESFNPVVLAPDGSPDGEKTIADLVTEIVAKHESLAKPTGHIGAGSHMASNGSTRDGKPDLSTPEGRNAYMQSRISGGG